VTFWKQLSHVLPPSPGINVRQNSSTNRPAAFALLLHASDKTEPLPFAFRTQTHHPQLAEIFTPFPDDDKHLFLLKVVHIFTEFTKP
jgi:hypothetical protein